ncbi:M42 family metallopeptidase [Haploplasma axanthum]|uniref:Aminopeptidase ysdC n=1 Tax=Haploplasma axanthum TaxID=29552 RepID=A0A449BEM1_HAPAX|nr:M42 family metallopeptidase [Haploplasma axanthum]VEU80872.1 Putative aminopeptidase ysdC [Haploplasma axanthum]
MSKELLKKLSEANGVPGNEFQVARLIEKEIKPLVTEIKKDNLGSVIGVKEGNGPHILIGGHMDEVGLMVKGITNEGFIKFQTLGGWYSQVMLAQEWQITTKKGIVIGVTGSKPPHIIPLEKRKEAANIDDMFLDVGVSSKEEAIKLGIEPGNMITPLQEFRELGNKNYLLGKAWDNRIGSAVVIEVLKNLKDTKLDNKLFGAFTVQEEVGLRGAKTTSYVVEPQIAFAIDTGFGNDVPGSVSEEQTLGKGPQILLFDGGLIAHRGLRKFVIDIAKELNIPYQEGVINGGRTDAGEMHLSHSGAAALSICIPTRYMHSHTSVIHYEDFQNTVKLMTEVLRRLNAETVNKILFDFE